MENSLLVVRPSAPHVQNTTSAMVEIRFLVLRVRSNLCLDRAIAYHVPMGLGVILDLAV